MILFQIRKRIKGKGDNKKKKKREKENSSFLFYLQEASCLKNRLEGKPQFLFIKDMLSKTNSNNDSMY